MNKKYFGLFLLGTAVLCYSCIDDTYDLKKGVATDVKIEGNKLSLPLGSLSPLVLDSLLNEDSIPMLEVDGKTRAYSLSLNDSLITRVAKKDLEALQELSKLSADIDPIKIEMNEIKFNLPSFEQKDTLSFGNVELEDVKLDAVEEKVTLTINEFEIDPIVIEEDKSSTEFEIPEVNVKTIDVAGYKETASFTIDEVKVETITTDEVESTMGVGVEDIDMTNISTPKLTTNQATKLEIEAVDELVAGLEALGITKLDKDYTIQITANSEAAGKVDVDFEYILPKEVKSINKIEMSGDKGSLIDFCVKNPVLLNGLSRTLSFDIEFPENYELYLYNTQYYTLQGSTISVTNLPADGDETRIQFYLKSIKDIENLNVKQQDGSVMVAIKDAIEYTIYYNVDGDATFKQGTEINSLEEGLTYSLALDSEFNVEEVYGSTNPVESTLKTAEMDFSFTIDGLDYITYVDRVVLKNNSELKFETAIDKGFGDGFDIDASNSKIVLSLPTAYVLADNLTLPDDVVRVEGTNDFEIPNIAVLNNSEWTLPVKEVKIQSDVNDGSLMLKTKAYLKAVSNGKEGILTIKGVDNLKLKESTAFLCQDREITFKAESTELDVDNVTGKTDAIDVPLAAENFELKFDINNLEYVNYINNIEFVDGQTITISSTSESPLGDIVFDEGSAIAICFPDKFVFDADAGASTLPYDKSLNAFLINNLSELKNGKWTLALDQININKEVSNKTLSFDDVVTLKAVNNRGTDNVLYVKTGQNGDFELTELQKLFGEHEIDFVVENSKVSVKELVGKSDEIDVDFAGETVSYPIKLEGLEYISYIGNITLQNGNNFFKFRPSLSKQLGQFNLAEGSVVEFIFPEAFELDASSSTVPDGVSFDGTNKVQIANIGALNANIDWELAVSKISIGKDVINKEFESDYTIRVVGRNAAGEEGGLTIGALDNFCLTAIEEASGKGTMDFTMLKSTIVVEDIDASISDIDFEFETQSFDFPVEIEGIEMVKEIQKIVFEEEKNEINLKVSIDGNLEPFDLASNSRIKISLPEEFVLKEKSCNFAGLEYNKDENAIYVEKISDLKKCEMTLVLERIDIYDEVVDGVFDWNGAITVSAVNADGTEGKLFVTCTKENPTFNDVKGAMGDKLVHFNIDKTTLAIKEAVLISDFVESEFNEIVEIPLDEVLTEPIDRVDSIGFVNPVPMTLKLVATGLETVKEPVKLDMEIMLPSVFALSSDDDKVEIVEDTDKDSLCVKITTEHKFSESDSIVLNMLVNRLDFTKLEGGYLTLGKLDNGDRALKYDGQAKITGAASIEDATLSSDILEKDLTLDINFTMGEVALKNFTGLYAGEIEPVTESFELGIENGFEGLEENGLKLSNTKPELKISLYNTIGVPVNVDLAIVGRDKEGKAIGSSTIEAKGLRINPAELNEQGVLTAVTTQWLFTSNKDAKEEGYETVHVPNLDSLLNDLPYSIDFELVPQIVTKNTVHHVDLSKDLELGGSYAISVPFDLEFAQSVPLEFGEEVDGILRSKENKLTLSNPQLALSIHNPIAADLALDLAIIGKDADGKELETATLKFDEPFVLAAGTRNDDGSIVPTATRWLFAVNDSITKAGYETKEAPALATLLEEFPHKIDVALNAHFNTELTTNIDYEHDLELTCEYGILVPLQFNNLTLNYADTISEIKLNLEETLSEMGLSINNIGLALSMNLKNTLPLGLTLNLTPLDVNGKVIDGIEISDLELPAGNGEAIGNGADIEGTPVELSIMCASSDDLSKLDKVVFKINAASGNGDKALCGTQGLQISDIVLQILCDIELVMGE